MTILVIDGQGGAIGSQMVKRLTAEFSEARIIAAGTNSIATASMLKSGAVQAATGENAVTAAAVEKNRDNTWLGVAGLSDPEIEKERQDIFEAMCKRHNLDPKDCGSKIGTGHFYTPTEIHREQVLWAMSMANSVLCYNGTKEDWNRHAWKFQAQEVWQRDGLGMTRKFGYNKVQNEAYSLTAIETDKIWEAQKARISKATIIPNVVDDEEGTLNGIRW